MEKKSDLCQSHSREPRQRWSPDSSTDEWMKRKGLDSHSLRSRSPVVDNTKETWHNGGSSPKLTMGFKPRNENQEQPRTRVRNAKLQYKQKKPVLPVRLFFHSPPSGGQLHVQFVSLVPEFPPGPHFPVARHMQIVIVRYVG